MRRLFRLLFLAAVVAALIKLLRELLEEDAGLAGGGETVPAAASRPREEVKPAGQPAATEAKGDGAAALSKAELYERAKELEIEGRSKMSKSELQRAVEERESD